ncbi:MAG: hypothetical protein Q9159_005642 [Coniocarpon cinnabarinum]
MSAIRQKFLPKHQVLILRCYPRFQRGANVEVKPNSSELSYLLFYASSRRSKLPKVGAFLVKKTSSDIYRNRQGNVQVTLQILRALIESCSRDLPIFSSFVLQVLHDVLHSHHVALLESSVPTFEAFCNHYDVAQLAADPEHIKQFDDILNRYAQFASHNHAPAGKAPPSTNIAVRNRKAGMQAIKSLVSAESFAADNGRQLRVLVPVILENIYSDTPGLLLRLKSRELSQDERERNQRERARPGTNASYADDKSDADPIDALGTAEDADERALEDVAVLAMQCLRQVSAMDAPLQIRVATQCAVVFLTKHNQTQNPSGGQATTNSTLEHWAIELFQEVSNWSSVQTRFIVLVTLTDALTRSPIAEGALNDQLLLVRIIGSLLRSDTTFIGLSVNDVLIGFVNHILLLLQLGGQDSGVKPHRQQPTTHGLLDVSSEPSTERSPSTDHATETENTSKASPLRVLLLDELSGAIGDLATHIYYADQIGEMVGALLLRLKPPIAVVSSPTVAIENPSVTAEAIAESGNLQEDVTTDPYFSFGTARALALAAIKNIIEVSNSQRKDGQGAINRNRVPTSTWNGTQWLLCDPSGKVRKAYVDALITWMTFELDKSNLRVSQEQSKRARSTKHHDHQGNGSAIAKRALSNASKRSISNLRAHSNFLQLLTLAIHDNALQFAESEPDMLLLHLLLVSSIQKLGVNSVRHGLPMIFRLQEEIPNLESVSAKDAIGTLVHGYFWALSDVFDFDTRSIGRDIANEISRRSQLGLWRGQISVPALPVNEIRDPSDTPPRPHETTPRERTHALNPLTARTELVECINDAYFGSLLSPPSSPPTSPSRGRPMSSRSSSHKPPVFVTPTDQKLPQDILDQLLRPWSREECIAEADQKVAVARSSSVANSRSGSGSGREKTSGYLSPNGAVNVAESPGRSKIQNVSEIDLTRLGSTAGRQSVRVQELQRILETGQPARFAYRFSQPVPTSDADSDSMVSADVSSIT